MLLVDAAVAVEVVPLGVAGQKRRIVCVVILVNISCNESSCFFSLG